MQSQQAELDQLIDQADGALVERVAERQKREQHADREPLAGQDEACTEEDDDHVDQAEEPRVWMKANEIWYFPTEMPALVTSAKRLRGTSRSASRPISLMMVAARTVSMRCDCSLARANLLFHPVPHPGIEGEDKSQMQEEGEDHDRAQRHRIEEQDLPAAISAITPSMMLATTPRVIASWIGCTAPMRDRMSPT